jgi:demethylmenaquinone methyltransferase/2-methoxy-6-polyprenyl-1,4-benzoquinol methylase
MGVLEDKARARLFYKYLSKVYDTINPYIWTDEMRRTSVSMLDLSADDRVLDVGSGTGYGTEVLLEQVEEVHALDQSIHQMRKAFEKFGRRGRVRFVRGDAERLPFEKNAFDAVWSSGSIEYWPEPVVALREFRRVVRPGGKVLVVGPNRPRSPVRRRLADAMMLFYDEVEAQEMFEAAGFETVRHRLMGPEYEPDIAITSLARVPESDDAVTTPTPERDLEPDTGVEAE